MKRREHFEEFFVSRFLLILICVVIAEYAVKFLLDYSMMPVMKTWFFEDMEVGGALSIVEILLFTVFVLIELFLNAMRVILPDGLEAGFNASIESIENFAARIVPDIAGGYGVDELTAAKAWLLLLLSFTAIILFLLPLGIALKTFVSMVKDEVKDIQAETENFYKEYERQRNLLLSDIAHDLRTPITTISGYAKALNDGMVTDEEKKTEYLQAIENKSERMSELITLLFDYVRLGTEGFQLKQEQIDLAELMRKNAALIYSDIEEKGMEFYVDIPEEPCPIYGDEVQVSRVVTNLLTNAIRHNEAGTQITLELRNEGDTPEIIIADNGEQIPEEIARNIFEPFVVGDKSRRTKGGSGLGLSIAKKVVDMHGWELRLFQNCRGFKKAFVITIKQKGG